MQAPAGAMQGTRSHNHRNEGGSSKESGDMPVVTIADEGSNRPFDPVRDV
jgi:hypothetical protein